MMMMVTTQKTAAIPQFRSHASLRVLFGQVILVALLLLCVQVKGHGYMFQPAARNWLGRNSNPVITYTPHGGNGRGEKATHLLTLT
jgi:predicted carbohydrate-binding protein with CBM5 and CBM33 domain